MSLIDSLLSSAPPDAQRFSGGAAALAFSLALLLAACGGGQTDGNSADSKALAVATDTTAPDDAASSQPPSFLPTSSQPPSAETIATQQDGARLNSEELAQIAKTGVLPKAFEGRSLSGASEKAGVEGAAPKSAASRVPTHRFFNTRTSAHFFTTSEAERANVQATLPFMSFEGPAFHASSTAVPGLSPVHRFYNTRTGVHFYTISEAERAHVAATLPQFNYEGVAYHASTLPGTGYTPLYRFFYAAKGFHFYSNSAAERNNIIATLPQYNYEGVGYYVLGSDWQTPAVPHTGITVSQCFKANVPPDLLNALVTCAPTLQQQIMGNTSLDLNPQQDGHRRSINPLSYSQVVGQESQNCMRDNVTGLVWERAASTVMYTNLGNSAPTDASGYAAAINSARLCGFTDWRLPTIEELQGIAHYGVLTTPRIDTTAFFNTSTTRSYWSSDIRPGLAGHGINFNFGELSQQVAPLGDPKVVRLVRGAPWTWSMGDRHLVTSVTYAGDAANNAVLDRKTGLTWRRCQEGQAWSGSTCTGTTTNYTHEAALVRAKGQSGWRLPNAKELGSLIDRSRLAPALNQNLFPGAGPGGAVWSSSPYVGGAYGAWGVSFGDGYVYLGARGDGGYAVRLVRASQ